VVRLRSALGRAPSLRTLSVSPENANPCVVFQALLTIRRIMLRRRQGRLEAMGGFGRQLGAVLWKNWLLKCKHWKASIAEVSVLT
jgi:hypothetical protein